MPQVHVVHKVSTLLLSIAPWHRSTNRAHLSMQKDVHNHIYSAYYCSTVYIAMCTVLYIIQWVVIVIISTVPHTTWCFSSLCASLTCFSRPSQVRFLVPHTGQVKVWRLGPTLQHTHTQTYIHSWHMVFTLWYSWISSSLFGPVPSMIKWCTVLAIDFNPEPSTPSSSSPGTEYRIWCLSLFSKNHIVWPEILARN